MKCAPLDEAARDIVRRYLAQASTGWSVGTWGAIGEFQYDVGEPGLEIDLDALAVRTRRGALAVVDLDGVRPFALTNEAGRTCEIAFCSPRTGAARTTIAALDDTTFDLGIGAPHIDMLVRVRPEDSETLDILRAAAGRPLFAAGNPAAAAVARSGPARILASSVARLEVFQPIPPPGGASPEGPHTHLLPEFLKEGRAHRPNSPLPAGLFCGLSLYPRTRL